MNTLYLDIETYSGNDLKKAGAHRYAEDAEVILVQFAWDEGDVTVWDLTQGCLPHWPEALQDLLDEAREVVIHNSAFERSVLSRHGVHLDVAKIDDTMVVALQHGLPGSLDALCGILQVPRDSAKIKDGKKLIQLFCKPRPKNAKVRRATRETHPEEWAAFVEYARLDVIAMREVRRRTPRWNCTPHERHLWSLDQRINDRGFAVDQDLARAALRAFDRELVALAASAFEVTGGAVSSTTRRDATLRYLQERGLDVADLQKDNVAALLRQPLEGDVRAVLEIRQQASATSPAKYRALLSATGSDGRLRGSVQFCGAARTGRDAGRIFQPQNLPRPSMSAAAVDKAIAAMKLDCEDLIYDNVSAVCVSAVRGSLVAAPGRKLVIADLSNIEGRVLAWLAGEEWKCEAFRDYDKGTGHDLYVMAYSRSFGVPPAQVVENKKTGDGSMRQIGKVMELALGYQGGPGAFLKMGGTTAEALGEDAIVATVKAWRAAHPAVVSLWYDLEAAAREALRRRGTAVIVRDVAFDCVTDAFGVDWLRMKLPSRRYLCYARPEIDYHECKTCEGSGSVLVGGTSEDQSTPQRILCPNCKGVGSWGSGGITYEGLHHITRQWTRLETYGGKFTENAVQAISRDLFMHGMSAAEDGLTRDAGPDSGVVLRVHDELVCEVPDEEAYTCDILASLMATNPAWAIGLPLAAAGFEAHRYKKE